MIGAVIGFFFIAISVGLATWYIARFLERDEF
jgi:cytochrome oxidase assembly protein ShyY1